MVARLKQLDAAWRAELQPQADAITTDKRALDAQASTLDRATLDAKTANLQLRVSNIEKLAQQRQQEMQATQQKQIGVIQVQLDPILRQLFQGKSCSVLVERDQGAVGRGQSGDGPVRLRRRAPGLDAKITDAQL